jgi:hypothetical protein
MQQRKNRSQQVQKGIRVNPEAETNSAWSRSDEVASVLDTMCNKLQGVIIRDA